MRSQIPNTPDGKLKPTDVSAILAEIFKPQSEIAALVNTFIAVHTEAEQDLRQANARLL
ncbi:hypothetical protein [Nostoc sp. LEGE 12450]|uniref:hypothetical protein n=1 Tax=Nostoc sp. LEGE 12450 TaxID=1828643 RepID=UPI00188266B8|nr:hypothetical protein [Nostoc sp. LEGE 12450]MBE8989174.1 hypothetical protein [Nostoc sp. LEGE 12450]